MNHKDLRLKVGLQIVVKCETPGKEERTVGTILGWEDGNMIIMKFMKEADPQSFSGGTSITVGFIDEGIVNGFNSKILSSFEVKESNLFFVQYPEKLEKIQLRKERRLKVNFQATFKVILDDKEGNESHPYNCNIVDLSPHGCGFTTNYVLKSGKRVLISFLIPLQGKITDIPGTVVNEGRTSEDEFKYGIKFDEGDQQRGIIASYKSVVEIMRESSINK